MSRLPNKPVPIPKGIKIDFHPNFIEVKSEKKTVMIKVFPHIKTVEENNNIYVKLQEGADRDEQKANLGTLWALLKNAINGLSKGFERKLSLVGVGYRAAVQGKTLNLTLGFSHPVVLTIPENVDIKTPSQTEIVITSHDKQLLGQVVSKIRAYRPPECYKGKGVRELDSNGKLIPIVMKEIKKK